MSTRRPFWKWPRWKSIGFCLWPPSICLWNLKLKFQSKLDLCSGNHVVYRRTDGRTRWIQDTPSPFNFVGRGYYNKTSIGLHSQMPPHSWPLWASYGMSFVSYKKENDRDISRGHYLQHSTRNIPLLWLDWYVKHLRQVVHRVLWLMTYSLARERKSIITSWKARLFIVPQLFYFYLNTSLCCVDSEVFAEY